IRKRCGGCARGGDGDASMMVCVEGSVMKENQGACGWRGGQRWWWLEKDGDGGSD
ncbi:hypothetical protein Tco_0959752, partial [Tanacetum coccineum]